VIFFDLDGTLFDATTAQVYAWDSSFLRVTGRHVALSDVNHHGSTARMLVSLLAEPEELAEETRRAVLAEHAAVLRDELSDGLTPLPGVLETLAYLSGRGIPLGVATGNSAEATRVLLESSQTLAFFQAFLCGDEATSRAELIALTSNAAGPSRPIVVVGDTPHDLTAAMVNSCLAVGVASGVYTAEELGRLSPALVLPDLGPPAELRIASLYLERL
jgi:phosphoglycolate phosphatase-like HAD superfamily hydrolase